MRGEFVSLKYKKSSARGQWQVQEAKARFSELFRTARSAGPQRVSHHGKEGVVVLAEEDFLLLQRKKARRGSLVEFFARSPLAKTKIDLSRNTEDVEPTGVPFQNPWE
jgi:antitoxin Phd